MLFVIQMIDQDMKFSIDQVQKIVSKGYFSQLKSRNLGKDIQGEKNMNSKYIEILKRHISTHTVCSAEDRSAVSYLVVF